MSNESKELVTAAKKSIGKTDNFTNAKSSEIMNFLNLYKSSITQALPNYLTADKMISVAVSMLTRNPKLAECTAESLIGFVMKASILGFEPVENLGLCYAVPYWNSKINKNEIQFQIGYQGLIKLVQNTGELKGIWADVVYKQDGFEYEKGLYPKLIHKPDYDAEQDDKDIIFAYACAELSNGAREFVILTRKRIENLRKRSPMQKKGISGAWETDYSEMAKAKAIKALSKYLPKSTAIKEAVAVDNATIRFNTDKDAADRLTTDYEYSIEEPKEIATTEPESPSTMTPEEIAEYKLEMENK